MQHPIGMWFSPMHTIKWNLGRQACAAGSKWGTLKCDRWKLWISTSTSSTTEIYWLHIHFCDLLKKTVLCPADLRTKLQYGLKTSGNNEIQQQQKKHSIDHIKLMTLWWMFSKHFWNFPVAILLAISSRVHRCGSVVKYHGWNLQLIVAASSSSPIF